MLHKRFILSLATLSFLSNVNIVNANELLRQNGDHKSIINLSFENDYFDGTDDGYTNGVRVSYLSAETEIPSWIENSAAYMPFFSQEGHKRYSFALGQSMFSPTDLTQSQLIVDDRPYAGFLYGSVGLLSDTGYQLDNLQLTLGVVGPASLAEQTQKFVHDNIAGVYPQGWDNQLENEPGIILTYERKWRGICQLEPFGFAIDATPNMGASIGNIHTYAASGIMFRLGYDLPSDYGPPLIRPSLPGSDFFVPTKDLGWYLFAGVEGRAVARNIFLDGNTFTDSHSVDKELFVGGLQAGFAVTFENTRLAYTHIFRTREFQNQKGTEAFGAITVSYRF